MTLRHTLDNILPEIVPAAPAKMIGTEIIKEIRARGFATYSNQSIRCQLTQISNDRGGVIYKPDEGQQGYSLRKQPLAPLDDHEREELEAHRAALEAMRTAALELLTKTEAAISSMHAFQPQNQNENQQTKETVCH